MTKTLTTTIALAAVLSMAIAQTATIRLRADLTGVGKGKASWKSVTKKNGAEAELEVEAKKFVPGEALVIAVDGLSPLAAVADKTGKLEIETEFHGKTVPSVAAGANVRIINASGAIVLQGTFK